VRPESAPEIALRLVVRPATKGLPWSARLEDGAETNEFHSPLELARHIARLGGSSEPPRGLR